MKKKIMLIQCTLKFVWSNNIQSLQVYLSPLSFEMVSEKMREGLTGLCDIEERYLTKGLCQNPCNAGFIPRCSVTAATGGSCIYGLLSEFRQCPPLTLISVVGLSESLSCPSSALRLSLLMLSPCQGLPHHCNGKPLGKPKVSVHATHEPRDTQDENYTLCLTTRSILLTKLGPPYVGRKLPCKTLFSQNLNKGCGNTSLLSVFSSTYIIFLLPTHKTKRHTDYCLASTNTFAVPSPKPGRKACLIRFKVYDRGFGRGVGSDFEEWGWQTKTDKLKSALQTFILNLCSFSEENLLHR